MDKPTNNNPKKPPVEAPSMPAKKPPVPEVRPPGKISRPGYPRK